MFRICAVPKNTPIDQSLALNLELAQAFIRDAAAKRDAAYSINALNHQSSCKEEAENEVLFDRLFPDRQR